MKSLVVALIGFAASSGAQVMAPTGSMTAPSVALQRVSLPPPILKYLAQQSYQSGGKTWVRVTYEITNRAVYPAVFWTKAPSLPPCGTNANASRAWVDIFAENGTRLYGYCAATSADEFRVFGFQLEQGAAVPARVYVVITDRATGRKLHSNMATTEVPQQPEIH